jgi:predicted transcriptional regulator
MSALWEMGSGTVRELQAALGKKLAYTTVLTLARILEDKGYVRHAPGPEGSRAYVYSPAVSRDTARRRHVGDLVERMFNGHTPDLVSGLIEDEVLSSDELRALRRLIDQKLVRKGEK